MERAQRNLRWLFLAVETAVFMIPVALRLDRRRFMDPGDPIGDCLGISYIVCLAALLIISSALLPYPNRLDRVLTAIGIVTVTVAVFLHTLG